MTTLSPWQQLPLTTCKLQILDIIFVLWYNGYILYYYNPIVMVTVPMNVYQDNVVGFVVFKDYLFLFVTLWWARLIFWKLSNIFDLIANFYQFFGPPCIWIEIRFNWTSDVFVEWKSLCTVGSTSSTIYGTNTIAFLICAPAAVSSGDC